MATETKTTRVRRVEIDGNTISFMGHVGKITDFPTVTAEAVIRYGWTQILQDALAGESDKQAAADVIWAKLLSGDLSRARTSGGKIVTLASVAADLYRIAWRAKNSKAPTADELKAGVAKWLADPKAAAVVKAKFDALSEMEGLDV